MSREPGNPWPRGLNTNETTYSAVISVYEKDEPWWKVLKLMGAMLERDLKPEMTTYSAAISVCEKR